MICFSLGWLSHLILKLIASILKSIIKTNISKPILVSTFNRFEGSILDPFNYCCSEYHLSNWLIEIKLLPSVQQITINTQLCSVNRGGEICFNEKELKVLFCQ